MTRAGEKLLTTTLATGCAVLFAFAAAMQIGIGRGYHWLAPEGVSNDAGSGGTIDRESFELPPQSNFAAIGERPLFNEDRKPAIEEPVDTTPAPPPSPLNISLTGTLLVGDPELRVAMIRENGKVNTVALKEGMPLPGEQSAWTLSQVKKRSAIFKNTAGEEAEVELATVTASQKPGTPARLGTPAPNRTTTTPTPPAGSPVAQSEELQHRIEERRKQMREAAERMKAQQPPEQPPGQQQPQQQ